MLVELGILSSGPDGHFSEGDVRRVRLMKTLERAGMPLRGVAAAVQSGNLSLGFLDTAAYDRLASLSEVTLQEVSEKTGIPVELLMVIREAVGFAEPPAGGSPPRERAPDRPAGRGTDLRRVSPDGDRTLAARVRRQFAADRGNRGRLVAHRGGAALAQVRDDASGDDRSRGLARRAADRPIPRPDDPRHVPRTPGAHVDEEHPRRDRGDPVRGGRLQPPGAAPGHLLPRYHGLHPAH
jgi:hypothetical protein